MGGYGWRAGLVVVLAAGAAVAQAAENLSVRPLVRGNDVLVSFELPEAYSAEVRAAISAGLPTTFTYNVELRQVVSWWVDRTVASAVVSITNTYDSLTGRHSLTRRVDGRVMDAVVTQDEEIVRTWLTTLTRLPLCQSSRLEPNRDYYVRVDARGRPNGESMLGRASAFSGQARFTFIP